MTRLLAALLLGIAFVSPAFAEDYVPDDTVIVSLSTEGFVTTQTANVTVMVDAAADDSKAATLRADMQKAVDSLAKGEWRLTSFNRSQDQTGLSRWQASYEARVPESALAGINDRAKNASKAGMQLRVINVDFTPTLAETEARRSELRAELVKRANEELTKLNNQMNGRTYRIAGLNFAGGMMPMPVPMMARTYMKGAPEMMAASAPAMDMAGGSAEVAQRISVTAQVVYGARPTAQASR